MGPVSSIKKSVGPLLRLGHFGHPFSPQPHALQALSDLCGAYELQLAFQLSWQEAVSTKFFDFKFGDWSCQVLAAYQLRAFEVCLSALVLANAAGNRRNAKVLSKRHQPTVDQTIC